MAYIRYLLKDRNFLYLYIGQIISQFGDKLNQMALIAILYERFPNSSFQLAKLLSFTILPVFLIGPVAGVYVDRYNRRRIMLICDISRAGLVLAIPFFATYVRSFFPIYIVVFLVFSITRFFLPSKLAIIPEIVSADKLLLANSIFSTTGMIAAVIGLSLSGVLIAIVGPFVGFFIDSCTYLISALFIYIINPASAPKQAAQETKLQFNNILKQIYEGLVYIIQDKKARFIMQTFLILMAAGGSLYAVMIVFVQESLRSVTKDLGFLASFLGIGLFIGTVIYGRFGARLAKEKAVLASFACAGIILVIFVFELKFVGSFFISIFLMALLGASLSPIAASIQTIIHETAPDDIRGRFFSSIEIVAHISFLIFMFIGAGLSEHIGRVFIIVAVGICLTFFGLFGMIKSNGSY